MAGIGVAAGLLGEALGISIDVVGVECECSISLAALKILLDSPVVIFTLFAVGIVLIAIATGFAIYWLGNYVGNLTCKE